MKTLITDTLDRTVRTTGFKASLQRGSDEVKIAKAEQDRLDRIAKDEQELEDWLRGRKDSADLVVKIKEAMTKAADSGLSKINFPIADGINRKETAYDRGLLDGVVIWLKNETFKFEVVRSDIAQDEAGPDSYHLSVKASW
jgi:hypothetical protein